MCKNYDFQVKAYNSNNQVPWLAITATFRPPLNAGSMALGSTTCRGQRHGLGKGEERNGGGNVREWQGVPVTDRER